MGKWSAMADCPRCGRENELEATNCVRCGLDLTEPYEVASEPDPPSQFCYRHPKVPTNLSCGRCERPICTKCAVIGANGVRCRDCARQNIPVRPGAVAYEVKRSIFQILRFGPWGIWMLITVIGFVFYMVRSCAAPGPSHREPPPVESSGPE